jgi:hypothetical protein
VPLDWGKVVDRYQNGAEVEPVPGASPVKVTGADEERIYIAHRLWKDSLSRQNLEKAVELLEQNKIPKDVEDLIGPYRMYVADERPTIAAVILKDLGYLD